MGTPTEPDVPTSDELDHMEKIVHNTVEALQGNSEFPPHRWNTMKDMRKALGLPLGTDGIAEFLEFWDSLNQAQRIQMRRDDLTNINEWDWVPSTGNKENTDV